MLLGASAASIDNPGLLYAPTTGQRTAQPTAVEEVASGPEIRITPGKRAFVFRVDDVASWIDLLQPNSRVDILVVTNAPEQQRPVARLLMENMRLLAIRAVPERLPDGRAVKTVVASIEVTPDEGERLAIATVEGSLRLVLRGYRDPDSARLGQVSPRLIRTR